MHLDRQLVASQGVTGLPLDPELRQARVAFAKQILAQLASYDRTKLTPAQHTSVGVIETNLNRIVDIVPVADEWFVFDQFNGLHVTLVNFLSQTHPVREPPRHRELSRRASGWLRRSSTSGSP